KVDNKPRTQALRYPTMSEEDKEYYNPLLEEYVDIVHFTLSIANDLGYHEHKYVNPGHFDLNDLTLGLTQLVTVLPYAKNNKLPLSFDYVIKLGYQLGFDEKTVIDAYFEKNKVNHERQVNNY